MLQPGKAVSHKGGGLMAPPFVVYDLDEADFEKCRKALETIPREQWPSLEMHDRVYLSCCLKAMEMAEREPDKEGDTDDAQASRGHIRR